MFQARQNKEGRYDKPVDGSFPYPFLLSLIKIDDAYMAMGGC